MRSLKKQRTRINTSVTNTIPLVKEKEEITYEKVKVFVDNITNSFIEYGVHLYKSYQKETQNEDFTTKIKNSYLRNVRFLVNPNWNDLNTKSNVEYPDHQSFDGIRDIFYALTPEKKDKWIFQHVSFSESISVELFEAFIYGKYHDEFMKNNDINYQKFIYYYDILMNIDNPNKNIIYHIGSLLHIDGLSSVFQEYEPLEASIVTKNMVTAIYSFHLLKGKKINILLNKLNIDIHEYINVFLIPFLSASYAMIYLNMEDLLIEINHDIINYPPIINPHDSWIEEEDDEETFKEYLKQKEKDAKLRDAMNALKEEEHNRIKEEMPIVYYEGKTPEILNKRFVQIIENERANALNEVKSSPTHLINNVKVKNSPTSSIASSQYTHNTNKITYISPDFIFENEKVPKSIRRRDGNSSNGRTDGFLLFHAGSELDCTFERYAIPTHNGKCSIKELCKNLPLLLVEKERFLRKSRDKIFGKSLEELYNADIANKTFYYTNLRRAIISLCNEMNATGRYENDLRMNILQKYYGIRREDESEKMYVSSFMYDVFRAFIHFYTYAKTL